MREYYFLNLEKQDFINFTSYYYKTNSHIPVSPTFLARISHTVCLFLTSKTQTELSILRAQKSVHINLHILMYICVCLYKICQFLQPNVSILYFLRNYCNALVNVSFLSPDNLQTFLSVNSSKHTSVIVN